MPSEQVTCPHNESVSCARCRLSSICLPLSLASDDVVKLEAIVQQGRPLQKGEALYKQGVEFQSVYAVRSGALKASSVSSSGEEQVVGFYLPGEILGIDGIGGHAYTSTAVALDTSAVCEIPFSQLAQLSRELPELQRQFFRLMSGAISDDQKLLTLISKNTADERVAAFLLSLSARHAQRQLSSSQFQLPMSRQDIANFLSLTIETVSRVLGKFKRSDVITVSGKDISILDSAALKGIAKIVV